MAIVKVFVDSTPVFSTSITQMPINFLIRTSRWTDGPHNIKIDIVAKNMGYFTLFEVPLIEFNKVLVFDQSKPEAVTLDEYEWENNHPKLFWTESKSLNFKSYIVQRSYESSFSSIDTITEKEITSYVDTSTIKIVGEDLASYRIIVSNGVEGSTSNELSISFGQRLPFYIYDDYYYNCSQQVPDNDIIINLDKDSSKIKIMTYDNGPIIHSLTNIDPLTISENYGRNHIYILGKTLEEKLYRLDLQSYNLNLLSQFDQQLYYAASIIEAKNQRLFAFGGHIELYNINTGGLLYSKWIDGHSNPADMCFSPDSTLLYVSSNHKFYCLSLEDDSVSFLNIVQTPAYRLRDLIYEPNTEKLVGWEQPWSIDFYEPISLNLVSTFIQGTSIYPNNLYLVGSSLYVAFSDNSQQISYSHGLVIKYDVNNMQILKEWRFKDIVKTILVLKESNKMIVYTYSTTFGVYYFSWLIDLD